MYKQKTYPNIAKTSNIEVRDRQRSHKKASPLPHTTAFNALHPIRPTTQQASHLPHDIIYNTMPFIHFKP